MIKMEQTNKSQTATSPEVDQETGKKLKWKDRTLYKTPDGRSTYLTARQLTIARKIEKLYEEGKLSDVVSVGTMNQFFRQRYILGLEGYEKFFAKMYYKAYILNFIKYKKDQDTKRKRRQLQRPGERS